MTYVVQTLFCLCCPSGAGCNNAHADVGPPKPSRAVGGLKMSCIPYCVLVIFIMFNKKNPTVYIFTFNPNYMIWFVIGVNCHYQYLILSAANIDMRQS